jgi:hypothetical protein
VLLLKGPPIQAWAEKDGTRHKAQKIPKSFFIDASNQTETLEINRLGRIS